MTSRRCCHSAVAAGDVVVARLERNCHGRLCDADLTDDVGDADEPDVVDERSAARRPTRRATRSSAAPSTRSRRRPFAPPSRRARAVRRPRGRRRDPLHRRVDDEEQIALAAEIRDGAPRFAIEHRAGGHRRAHHQEHARPIGDGRAQTRRGRGSSRRPSGSSRARPRHAAGDANPVQQPGVDRIGEHDLVARLERREQDVEDPVQRRRR